MDRMSCWRGPAAAHQKRATRSADCNPVKREKPLPNGQMRGECAVTGGDRYPVERSLGPLRPLSRSPRPLVEGDG